MFELRRLPTLPDHSSSVELHKPLSGAILTRPTATTPFQTAVSRMFPFTEGFFASIPLHTDDMLERLQELRDADLVLVALVRTIGLFLAVGL